MYLIRSETFIEIDSMQHRKISNLLCISRVTYSFNIFKSDLFSVNDLFIAGCPLSEKRKSGHGGKGPP